MVEDGLGMEVFSMATHKRLVRRIVRAYPSFLARAFLRGRFLILNVNILNLVKLVLLGRKRVLDIGCGFGLLGCYLGAQDSGLSYLGCDVDAHRIEMATRAAQALGLGNVRFALQDVRQLRLDEQFDAIVLVDCLHHIDDRSKRELVKTCRQHLAPDGLLILKEVSRYPWLKMAYTWVLDVLVTRGFQMWYWTETRFVRELMSAGYDTQVYPITDWLPYPHVLYRCSKSQAFTKAVQSAEPTTGVTEA